MVNKAPHPSEINDMNWSKPVHGTMRKGRRKIEIGFPEPLFHAILDEAMSRKWSFSHMVRHLCEASIEGIE